jgi:hypothetical protein
MNGEKKVKEKKKLPTIPNNNAQRERKLMYQEPDQTANLVRASEYREQSAEQAQTVDNRAYQPALPTAEQAQTVDSLEIVNNEQNQSELPQKKKRGRKPLARD